MHAVYACEGYLDIFLLLVFSCPGQSPGRAIVLPPASALESALVAAPSSSSSLDF